VLAQLPHSDAVDIAHYEIKEFHPFGTILLGEIHLLVYRWQGVHKQVMLFQVDSQLAPHLAVVGCHLFCAPFRILSAIERAMANCEEDLRTIAFRSFPGGKEPLGMGLLWT
jgi:hypothetical protein